MLEFYTLKNFGLNVLSVRYYGVNSERKCGDERESEHYEIELIIGGKGNCSHNDTVKYLKKGDIILKKPWDKVELASSCESILISFYVYSESGEKIDFIKYLPQTVIPRVSSLLISTLNKYHDYFILFKESLNLFNENTWINTLAVQSNLFRILYYYFKDLVDTSNRQPLSKRDIYIIEQVKKYIHLHYTKNIKLEELSEFANLSPSHLGRLFKKVENVAPLEYTIALRLDCAREMLLVTDKSIKEISFSCGFENVSYFCTLFKKKIGVTPQEYRLKGY